jgi:hypothetical protein
MRNETTIVKIEEHLPGRENGKEALGRLMSTRLGERQSVALGQISSAMTMDDKIQGNWC